MGGASASDAGRLYAFAVGFGLHRSADGGSTWSLLTAGAPQGTNSIVEMPEGTIILGATDQGILRSEDGGKTWTQSRTGLDVGAIYAIKGNQEGARIYAGTDHGTTSVRTAARRGARRLSTTPGSSRLA